MAYFRVEIAPSGASRDGEPIFDIDIDKNGSVTSIAKTKQEFQRILKRREYIAARLIASIQEVGLDFIEGTATQADIDAANSAVVNAQRDLYIGNQALQMFPGGLLL